MSYLRPYRNYTSLAFGVLSFIAVSYIQYYFFSNFQPASKPRSSFFPLLMCGQLITLTCAIWATTIAKKNNHGALLWFFISLLFGPIGLIIISLKDYKFKDPNVSTLVQEVRKEYKDQIDLNKGNSTDITAHFENLLSEKLKISSAASPNELEASKIEWNPDWIKSELVCPACGSEVTKDASKCSSCGLNLE